MLRPRSRGRVHFGLTDPDKAVDDALAAAVEDATRKANRLAETAKAKLGRLQQVTYPPRTAVRPFEAAAAPGGRALRMDVPIEAGALETSVEVEMVWALINWQLVALVGYICPTNHNGSHPPAKGCTSSAIPSLRTRQTLRSAYSSYHQQISSQLRWTDKVRCHWLDCNQSRRCLLDPWQYCSSSGNTGPDPDHRRLLDAKRHGDGVSGLEADAADVSRQPVRVF
jgi:hypothetical protein